MTIFLWIANWLNCKTRQTTVSPYKHAQTGMTGKRRCLSHQVPRILPIFSLLLNMLRPNDELKSWPSLKYMKLGYRFCIMRRYNQIKRALSTKNLGVSGAIFSPCIRSDQHLRRRNGDEYIYKSYFHNTTETNLQDVGLRVHHVKKSLSGRGVVLRRTGECISTFRPVCSGRPQESVWLTRVDAV